MGWLAILKVVTGLQQRVQWPACSAHWGLNVYGRCGSAAGQAPLALVKALDGGAIGLSSIVPATLALLLAVLNYVSAEARHSNL